MKSFYITNKRGQIKIRKNAQFFTFATRTIFSDSAVKTTRRMALGLIDYFLANEDFQKRILAEGEAHARAFAGK